MDEVPAYGWSRRRDDMKQEDAAQEEVVVQVTHALETSKSIPITDDVSAFNDIVQSITIRDTEEVDTEMQESLKGEASVDVIDSMRPRTNSVKINLFTSSGSRGMGEAQTSPQTIKMEYDFTADLAPLASAAATAGVNLNHVRKIFLTYIESTDNILNRLKRRFPSRNAGLGVP
jgi:hypothetical protein